MIPVFLHEAVGTRGCTFAEFEERVLQICEQHQREQRACAFAFIINDARSPHLEQVLRDSAYWTALDAISGKALTVFSVFAGTLRREDAFAPEDHAADMRRIEQGTRRVLDSHFGLTELTFPSVLFFQVDDGKVSASRLVKLKARGLLQAYLELEGLLQLAAQAVSDSIGKPIRDPGDAYSRLDRALTVSSLKASGNELVKTGNAVRPWLEKIFGWM